MDPKTLGILGTTLSALIAAVSYLAKTRHERRRATRAVLYYLLEVHHLVRRIHYALKSFPADYVDQCRRTLSSSGTPMPDADAAELREGLDQILRAYTTTELLGLSISIAEPLERALADLSREDPVLAFRLRGRDQLMLLSKKFEAAIASTEQPAEALPVVPFHQEYAPLDDFFREVTVAELEAAIRSTAWRCDVLTHLQVRLLLRSAAHEQSLEEVKKMVAELVDQLLVAERSRSTAPSEQRSSEA